MFLVQVYPGSVNCGTVLVLFKQEVILFVYIVNSVQKFGFGCRLSNWQGFP